MVPLWRGEPLRGSTILLYSELGFGDEILSLRFAKPVKDMGARVIISVRAPIVRLARGLAFVDAVVRQYGPAAYECVEVLQCDPPPWKPDYVCALLAAPMFTMGGTGQQLSGELAAARGLEIAYLSGGGVIGSIERCEKFFAEFYSPLVVVQSFFVLKLPLC